MGRSWLDTWGVALFVAFMAAVLLVPHTSLWFGLLFLVPILGALAVMLHMLRARLGLRRAARTLARQAPLRRLQGDERRALEWFGQPEQISWRMPRGVVVDLLAALDESRDQPVVRTLEGEHQHRVRGIHHDRHDVIGGVEVLLLPGADRALRAHNRAQVLLCGDIAVVLALNDAWKIHQARALLR